MGDIAIVADDLTGALDTAVPFAVPGARVSVALNACAPEEKADVSACCIESRHLSAAAAYEAVRDALRAARSSGTRILFKKVDSALRGNIGAELEALRDASGSEVIHFVPAFPAAGRVTYGGIQLIGGVPVAESPFGQDPLNPVTCSSVAQIIAMQSDLPVAVVPTGSSLPAGFRGVAVYDAATQGDIDAIARVLLAQDGPLALAGSSGLSRALAGALGVRCSREVSGGSDSLLVMCGSGNPASRAQCAHARSVAPSVEVPQEAMTDLSWLATEFPSFAKSVARVCSHEEPLVLVDASAPVPASAAGRLGITSDELRARISDQIGGLFSRLTRDLRPPAVMVMGGDALAAYLRDLGITMLEPFAELAPGVVASRVSVDGHHMVLVSKSGAFGDERLFADLAELLSGKPLRATAAA